MANVTKDILLVFALTCGVFIFWTLGASAFLPVLIPFIFLYLDKLTLKKFFLSNRETTDDQAFLEKKVIYPKIKNLFYVLVLPLLIVQIVLTSPYGGLNLDPSNQGLFGYFSKFVIHARVAIIDNNKYLLSLHENFPIFRTDRPLVVINGDETRVIPDYKDLVLFYIIGGLAYLFGSIISVIFLFNKEYRINLLKLHMLSSQHYKVSENAIKNITGLLIVTTTMVFLFLNFFEFTTFRYAYYLAVCALGSVFSTLPVHFIKTFDDLVKKISNGVKNA